MTQYHKRLHGSDTDVVAVDKPNALSLLAHIVRATLLDGMQWPVLFCVLLIVATYHFELAHRTSLAILIVTGIIVTGLLRGCNAWQHELNEYQHQLALTRHQDRDRVRNGDIPGYFPSRRY